MKYTGNIKDSAMLTTGVIMVVIGVLLLVPFLIVIMRLIAAFIIDAWNDRLDDFYGLFVFGGILLIFAGCVLCLHVWDKRHGLSPPKDPIGFTTEQQKETNNGNRDN